MGDGQPVAAVSRHLHLEAGFSQAEADTQLPRRVRFRRWALARATWWWSHPFGSSSWRAMSGDCRGNA